MVYTDKIFVDAFILGEIKVIKNMKKISYIAFTGFLVLQEPYNIKAEEFILLESSDEDYIILHYFANFKDSLTKEGGKENIISSFFTITDFLFYNGQIKGITLGEVSSTTQKKLYEIYYTMLDKIYDRYPSLLDIITNKYIFLQEWFLDFPKFFFEEAKDGYYLFLEYVDEYSHQRWGEDQIEDDPFNKKIGDYPKNYTPQDIFNFGEKEKVKTKTNYTQDIKEKYGY